MPQRKTLCASTYITAFYALFLVAGILGLFLLLLLLPTVTLSHENSSPSPPPQHSLVHSPSAHATIVVTGVGVSNPALWNAWATSYLYKLSNVQINYIQTDSSDSALAQISDGRASFVVSDGALPDFILPDQIQAGDIAQLPVVGSALVATYNLPGLSAQLVCIGTTHLFPSQKHFLLCLSFSSKRPFPYFSRISYS